MSRASWPFSARGLARCPLGPYARWFHLLFTLATRRRTMPAHALGGAARHGVRFDNAVEGSRFIQLAVDDFSILVSIS